MTEIDSYTSLPALSGPRIARSSLVVNPRVVIPEEDRCFCDELKTHKTSKRREREFRINSYGLGLEDSRLSV